MFAVAQWHDGRRVGTPLNGRDVTSVYARRRHGHRVLSLEGAEADDVAQQAILGGRRVSVPDAAAFRIDFPAFLAQLTPRRRQIALSLAQGEAPSAVAVAFGISRCRVSQLRCELHAAWQAFHGETQRVPGAA
jgi:DNA-binding NarL/FixJ family response regulator